MSQNIMKLKGDAESEIESILKRLSNDGVPIFRIQVFNCRSGSPQVNLVVDEKGGN